MIEALEKRPDLHDEYFRSQKGEKKSLFLIYSNTNLHARLNTTKKTAFIYDDFVGGLICPSSV